MIAHEHYKLTLKHFGEYDSESCSGKAKKSYRCITVRQRTVRYLFVNLPFVTVAIYTYSCCTSFMLHFHVALFSC